MTALARRCQEFITKRGISSFTTQRGMTLAQEFAGFVESEIGRAADPRLERSQALVMYFEDDAGREAFVDLWQQLHPNATVRKMP